MQVLGFDFNLKKSHQNNALADSSATATAAAVFSCAPKSIANPIWIYRFVFGGVWEMHKI